MPTAISLTRLAAGQIDETATMLARAFHDDPLNVWAIPDEETRRQVLPSFMGVAAQFGHRYGEVYVTDGPPEGAAIWLPPQDSELGQLRVLSRWLMSALLLGNAGLLAAPVKVGLDGIRRFFRMTNLFEELRKRDMGAPHWHLMVLGVEPERQGRGIGSALIQPVLGRADRDALPCYLETTKEINVRFYQRHDFGVVVEDSLPNGGPRFWTMKRTPR